MRIRDALLSARSYLTILIGFLLGFAIVVWVEKQMPARVESSGGMTLSQDFPPLPPPLCFGVSFFPPFRVFGPLRF